MRKVIVPSEILQGALGCMHNGPLHGAVQLVNGSVGLSKLLWQKVTYHQQTITLHFLIYFNQKSLCCIFHRLILHKSTIKKQLLQFIFILLNKQNEILTLAHLWIICPTCLFFQLFFRWRSWLVRRMTFSSRLRSCWDWSCQGCEQQLRDQPQSPHTHPGGVTFQESIKYTIMMGCTKKKSITTCNLMSIYSKC